MLRMRLCCEMEADYIIVRKAHEYVHKNRRKVRIVDVTIV